MIEAYHIYHAYFLSQRTCQLYVYHDNYSFWQLSTLHIFYLLERNYLWLHKITTNHNNIAKYPNNPHNIKTGISYYTKRNLPEGYIPDSKVPGVNIGPTWDLSVPNGPHVGPRNLAIRDRKPKTWRIFRKFWAKKGDQSYTDFMRLPSLSSKTWTQNADSCNTGLEL